MAVVVSETIALNAQPATGRIQFIPCMGRRGIVQSMYEVTVNLAGTAGGGEIEIVLTRDPRFQSIATLMSGSVTGAAAGVEIGFTLRDVEGSGPTARGFVNASPIASIFGLNPAAWNPPPIMTMNEWRIIAANVDGDSLQFQAWFYNFDVRILELVAMDKILACLPRPGLIDQAPNS